MRVRKLLAALVLGAWVFPTAPAETADDAEDPRRFLAVEEWRLTFTYESDDPYRWEENGAIIDRQSLREDQPDRCSSFGGRDHRR